MRLFAYLILIICVSTGALSAATAYLAPLSLDDATLVGKRLSADAGANEDNTPLIAAGTTLDAASLATLRDADVKYVTVAEFSFATWDTRFMALFMVSAIGLASGGIMLRVEAKRRLKRTEDDGTAAQSPESTIGALAEAVQQLRKDLPELADESARLHTIIERLNEAQRTHVANFIDAREKLIGKYGLGRFAMIMDRFAAAERQINRAWSAAADGVYAEAETCLATAADRLDETAKTLAG